MNVISRIALGLKSLFPQVVGTYPLTAANAAGIENNGGIQNNAASAAFLNALQLAASPQSGWVNYGTNSGATVTLTNLAGLTQVITTGGACTVTLDNAPNVVAQIPGPFNGMKFPMTIVTNASTTVATPTVTNTGITLAGTTSLVAASLRYYQGQITQLTTTAVNPLTAGTTYTSITQIGSTNLYTLALGTNAITTVVGNLIYLGVTAGTLPAGWYPCYSAGTTSIVIALPPTGTAWTATAVTMTQPAAPTAPVYAPLITLTGLYSTVTATTTT